MIKKTSSRTRKLDCTVRCVLLVVATLAFAAPSPGAQLAPLRQDEGANGLALALRQLSVTGRVLYVTAHPDDENNAVLVKLSRGLGLHTALLTLTRGDGGQNEIGPEQFEALGVLRTEELARVHRYDHARQYFTRAVDFGYSFSVEESFEKWGREEILADVVRVVRLERPDVIITLALEAEGGGQHHQASAILAREAFRAAADPKRFPGQIREGLRPWQAARIYQGGLGGGNIEPEEPGEAKEPTAVYDPLLGTTWFQYGGLARASHRCQGQERIVPLGIEKSLARIAPIVSRYRLVDAEGSRHEPGGRLFSGLDTTWNGLRRFAAGSASEATVTQGLRAIDEKSRGAAALDPGRPQEVAAAVAAGLRAIRELKTQAWASGLPDDAKAELRTRLDWKERDFLDALVLAQGLHVEAIADDGDVVRGQSFSTVVRVWNRGVTAIGLSRVDLAAPEGWTVRPGDDVPSRLEPGASAERRFEVTVSPQARYSQPYWKKAAQADRYEIERPQDFPLPWSRPELRAIVQYETAGTTAEVSRPALVRYTGRWVGGEKQKVVNVVPVLSVAVTPERTVIPLDATGAVREFRVRVQNNTRGARAASARLDLPPGFRAEPPSAPIALSFEGEEATAHFLVHAPRAREAGLFTLKAVVSADGVEHTQGHQVIAYDHVQERHLIRDAVARIERLDVAISPRARIGYIGAERDEVPEALEQIGFAVARLSAEEVTAGDLSPYTTIVTGIRAYKTRPDLRVANQRLLEFVRGGGNVVVQYNTLEFNRSGDPTRRTTTPDAQDAVSPFAPYPAVVTSERVSVEEAPLRILDPADEVFTTPNVIGEGDFAGWTQERGLYFFGAKDARYKELLESQDPWPKNPGAKRGILTEAGIGKGTWTYVGLGLSRQLAAGTPGAYRLMANLLSRPRN